MYKIFQKNYAKKNYIFLLEIYYKNYYLFFTIYS